MHWTKPVLLRRLTLDRMMFHRRAGERNTPRGGLGLSRSVPEISYGSSRAPGTLQTTSPTRSRQSRNTNRGSSNPRSTHLDEYLSSSAVLPRIARETDKGTPGSRMKRGNEKYSTSMTDYRGNAGDSPRQPSPSRAPTKVSGRMPHHTGSESVDRKSRRGKGTGSSGVARRSNSPSRHAGDTAAQAVNVTDRVISASTNTLKVSVAAQSPKAEDIGEAVAKSIMQFMASQEERDGDRPCRPGTVRMIDPMADCSLPAVKTATVKYRGPPLPKLEDILLYRASPDGRRPHPPLGSSTYGRRRQQPLGGASQRRCRNQLLAEPPSRLAPKMNATAGTCP